MTNVMVDLNPKSLEFVPTRPRRDGQTRTSALSKRPAALPLKHPCQEPSRQSRTARGLQEAESMVSGRPQTALNTSSVSSLFSALHETGKSTLLETTTVAALTLGALISIGAGFLNAGNLLAGMPSFARLVEMILS